MTIAVVIPAYNEARRIGGVLKALPKKIGGHHVLPVVVDDGSRDATSEVAREHSGVRVFRHGTNMGKGAAAKTGCDAAVRLGADIIVLMDADGQHRPEDLERIIDPLLHSERQLVIGVRERSGQMPFTMRFGNGVLNLITRVLFAVQVSDSQSGYRAFHASVYEDIRWVAPHYAMETEMLILAALNHVPIVEVSIPTIYHDGYKGTTVLDGLRILQTLIVRRIFGFHRESDSLLTSSQEATK